MACPERVKCDSPEQGQASSASAAAVLVFEHTWVIPLRDAIAGAGGSLLDTVRIPGQAVDALLEELKELEGVE